MSFIINRKTLISMLFIALTMLGYISYRDLPYELIPNTELPVLIVSVNSGTGVDPSYMENNAIIPVEGAVSTLENIESIESVVNSNQGMVFVYYNDKTDPKYAYLKLQEKMDQVRKELPDGFSVNVIRMNFENMNYRLMDLVAIGEGDINRVRKIAEDDIVPVFENIDGVASVEIYGGRKKSVLITLDDELCKSHDITVSQVNSAIFSHGLEKTFVGSVYDNNKRYFVNVESRYENIQDIGNIPLGKDNLLLKNVAEIYFGFREEERRSRINGKESVFIILQREPRSNMIDLSQKTKKAIAGQNEKLKSKGMEILVQKNHAEEMEDNMDQIIRLSLLGAILAVIVLWGFLRNLRIILVIALAIPISVYSSFNLFYAFGITINNFTMVGMILAIGMLLDNSIVVLENIYNLKARGMNTKDAVLQGTKEVLRPVIAATLTTISVFVPFLYSSNFFMKIYGANVGISIISTLIFSLLAALVLVPMVTHIMLQKNEKKGISYFQDITIQNTLIHRYVVILKACMRRPALTIFGSIALFFIILAISQVKTTSVLEEAELDNISLYVNMPGGSTLDQTDKAMQSVESKIMEIQEQEEISSQINEESGVINIKLKKDYEKKFKKTYAEIKDDILKRNKEIHSAELSYEPKQTGGGGGGFGRSNRGFTGLMRFLGVGEESERITIKGKDFRMMGNVASNLRNQLEENKSVKNARVDNNYNQPQLNLYFNKTIISQYGIPLNNVLAELTTFSNQVNSQMTLKTADDEFEIFIKTDNDTTEERGKDLSELKKLPVNNNNGASFELGEISGMVYSTGIGEILRVNQEKQIEITFSYINEITKSKSLLENAREEIDNLIVQASLPGGIAVELVHDEGALKQFRPLIIIALLLIYMILASIFESFFSPFIIMFTIPLAFVGAFIAVSITGNQLTNSNVMMGLLILLGIVVNNGIILIDYINLLKSRGYNEQRAIITAGISRLRPIFITAITTIIAMLPLAMGKSQYLGRIGAPFAITVIGGLTFSTILTLVFIPTFYSGLRRTISWFLSLGPRSRIIQGAISLILFILIIIYVETLLYQVIFTFVSIVAIPSITYLINNSLRVARSNIIKDNEPITITIRNLVKIYDREKRFKREWRYGKRFSQQFRLIGQKPGLNKLGFLVWQIPLLVYLVYFIYFYLNNNLWEFILAIVLYFYLLYFIRPFARYFENMALQKGKKKSRWFNITFTLLYWFYPIPNLIWFKNGWDNIAPVVIVGFFWYLILWFAKLASNIHEKNINIQRLTGRFKRIRYLIYNLVVRIPLIGKKQKPFKALKGVSMEIGTGMFGLLGPNGAGKSTLMKTVCGIIDQSYGKIFINEYDTLKKREELQGLIGYLPQEFGMYENMTAYGYLDYMAMLKNAFDPDKRKERVEYVLQEVNMYENAHDKISSFSGGMKQRVGIAQILLHLPRVLVVDEPTAGIDPRERIRFRNLLIELSRNRIIIFSTHIIEDISSSCNRVAVLNRGEIKYMGNPREMTKLAEGRVWQFFVHVDEFEQTYNRYKVVNHMRDGDKVRIRCVSSEKPVDHAESIQPNLEDAYLWLQSN